LAVAHPFEVAFGAALALTLTIKMLTGATAGNEPPEHAVEQVLEHQGFVIGKPQPGTEPQLIPAVRGDCTLRFTDISALGWHRDVLARLTKPDEVLYFVVGGRIFDEQPRWRTFVKYVTHRAAAYSGLNVGAPTPVLGVLAVRVCGRDAVDWQAIAGVGG
jgi:hypothetical protein